jgi:hypothetical protein
MALRMTQYSKKLTNLPSKVGFWEREKDLMNNLPIQK